MTDSILFPSEVNLAEIVEALAATPGLQSPHENVRRALYYALQNRHVRTTDSQTLLHEITSDFVLTFDLCGTDVLLLLKAIRTGFELAWTDDEIAMALRNTAVHKDFSGGDYYEMRPPITKPKVVEWEPLDEDQIDQVSAQLEIPRSGLELASARGVLVSGRCCGLAAYGITDYTGRAIFSQRIDGLPFTELAQRGIPARRTHTLKFSQAGWPVGLLETQMCPRIAVLQTIEDFLFFHAFVAEESLENEVAPVAILCAPKRFRHDAIPLFRGKAVCTLCVADNHDCVKGAKLWDQQFRDGGFRYNISSRQLMVWPGGAPVSSFYDLRNWSSGEIRNWLTTQQFFAL